MPKRDNKTITVGSAIPYLMEYADTVPTIEEVCKDEYLLGYIEGGAAVEYTEETETIKDDLGRVSKVVTTEEEAIVKLGLITWNGNTLEKLIDRSQVTEANGRRVTKIGGAGNAKGKYYVLCLHHIDKTDGDLWVMVVGRNSAGATLTLAADEATKLEPEFTAIPHDEDGTLIEITEQLPESAEPASNEPASNEPATGEE